MSKIVPVMEPLRMERRTENGSEGTQQAQAEKCFATQTMTTYLSLI